MKTVNVHEAKTRLSQLLDLTASGEEVSRLLQKIAHAQLTKGISKESYGGPTRLLPHL